MLILETGLQDRAAQTSPGYSQTLTQTRSPESLMYVYQTPLFLPSNPYPGNTHAALCRVTAG